MSSISSRRAQALLLLSSSCLFTGNALADCGPSATNGTLTAANTEAAPMSYTPAGDFALTIDLPAGYRVAHPQTYIRFVFAGSSAGGENISAGDASGDELDPTTHWASGRPGGADGDHAYMTASDGTRTATVTALSDATCVSIALVNLPDDAGDRTLPYAAAGNGPRFALYTPKKFAGLGQQFSEPSLGVNVTTGSVFTINTIDVLRTQFDDGTTPARDTWESKPAIESAVASLDPILALDQGTGRVFSLNLTGPVSSADYSDDDGETWLPGGNGFPTSGVDHQTLNAGPYPATGIGATIPHPLYANAVYYCSQGVADAYCSRSDDGGVNFAPAVTLYSNSECTGLHGHVKVAPDGTAYVPNKACALDFPTFGNGLPGLVVSEDAGITWTVKTAGTDATSASGAHGDPSVAIGKDNTVYLSYLSNDGHIHVAVSADHGDTWSNIDDLATLAGVHAAQFPEMVAGDAGRAAVAFLGTAFPDVSRIESSLGGLQLVSASDGDNDFPGRWYAYIATTLDYGAHWFVTKVAPNDVIQGQGGIGGGGDNRNLLDFNDAAIDAQGRVLAAFADGCMGGCELGHQGNTYGNARIAEIVRQTGGPRMYAQFDPVEPAVAPAPRLSGWRTKDFVVVDIDADNGGSPISGYNISRNGAVLARGFAGTRYVDLTAHDAGATYTYTATVVNGRGESAVSNAYAPQVDENAPVTAAVCTLPGQMWLDQVAEPGAETPESDLVSMGIAEPEDQPGKLVFTVTAGAPGGSMKLEFDHPNGRRYVIFIKPTGTTVGYTDGRYFSDTSSEESNIMFVVPDAPALDSSSGGTSAVYTAVLDKQAWGLATGDVLRNVTAFGLQASGNGQVFLRDFLGYDISQPIVGNDFCANGAHFAPPQVTVPPPVTPPVGGTGGEDKGRFGGGLPLLSLLVLFSGAALRRVARE